MARTARRFYQLEFDDDRPVFFEDFGQLLHVDGILFGGNGKQVLCLVPSCATQLDATPIKYLSVKDWGEILRQSDDPKILITSPDLNMNAWHRKVRYQISGAVQQKIWVRDGLQCAFCQLGMGMVQLTVDHWMPLELGGDNNQTNYITACRRCNKQKGSKHPKDFCEEQGYSYGQLCKLVASPVE